MTGYMDKIGSWVDRRSWAVQGFIMMFALFVLLPIVMVFADTYEWVESFFASKSGGSE